MSYYIWGEREGRGRRGGGRRAEDGGVLRAAAGVEARASQPHLHLGREGG